MRIRTLLNKFEYLKSFVYEKEYIEKKAHQERLIIEISARKNVKPSCSSCGKSHSIYDHKANARDFELVPLLGIPTFLYTE